MTEMLAALIGAVVGGLLAAWVGAWQTRRVLKHETELAAEERREAQRLDAQRRMGFAADQLIIAIGEFCTKRRRRNHSDHIADFVNVPAVSELHHGRTERVTNLLRAGAAHAFALPDDARKRWDALTWLVRFGDSSQPDSEERDGRNRDVQDIVNFAEYVRRSLSAVAGDEPMPAAHPAPDPRRLNPRPWGLRPEPTDNEPDLTDWHLSSRLVGKVSFSSGETRWYGPNGSVEEVFEPPSDAAV